MDPPPGGWLRIRPASPSSPAGPIPVQYLWIIGNDPARRRTRPDPTSPRPFPVSGRTTGPGWWQDLRHTLSGHAPRHVSAAQLCCMVPSMIHIPGSPPPARARDRDRGARPRGCLRVVPDPHGRAVVPRGLVGQWVLHRARLPAASIGRRRAHGTCRDQDDRRDRRGARICGRGCDGRDPCRRTGRRHDGRDPADPGHRPGWDRGLVRPDTEWPDLQPAGAGGIRLHRWRS